MKLDNDDLMTLEGLVDKSSLSEVLELLAHMCSEKGEHLRYNWQDETSAKVWDDHMMLLDNLVVKLGG